MRFIEGQPKFILRVREAITEAMRKANPAMFEPMQIHVIEMPDKFLSAVTKLVSGKRGQLLEVKQEEAQTEMKVKLPVAEMIGWSSDLRSATEGRGTSSLADQMFEKNSCKHPSRRCKKD